MAYPSPGAIQKLVKENFWILEYLTHYIDVHDTSRHINDKGAKTLYLLYIFPYHPLSKWPDKEYTSFWTMS